MGLRTINVSSGRYRRVAIVRESIDIFGRMTVMRSPVTRLYGKTADKLSRSDMINLILRRSQKPSQTNFRTFSLTHPIKVDRVKISETLPSVDGLAVLVKNSDLAMQTYILEDENQGVQINASYRLIMGLARTTSNLETISALSRYPIESIRAAIAVNKSTPDEILKILRSDPMEIVRQAINPQELSLKGLVSLLSRGIEIDLDRREDLMVRILPDSDKPQETGDELKNSLNKMTPRQIAVLLEALTWYEIAEIADQIKEEDKKLVMMEIKNSRILFEMIHTYLLPKFPQLSFFSSADGANNISDNLAKICRALFDDLKAFEYMKTQFERKYGRPFLGSKADIQNFKAEIIDMLLNLSEKDVFLLDKGNVFELLDKINNMIKAKKEDLVALQTERKIEALVDKYNSRQLRESETMPLIIYFSDFTALPPKIQDAVSSHPRLNPERAQALKKIIGYMRNR